MKIKKKPERGPLALTYQEFGLCGPLGVLVKLKEIGRQASRKTVTPGRECSPARRSPSRGHPRVPVTATGGQRLAGPVRCPPWVCEL